MTFLTDDEDVPPLGKSRELKSAFMSNIQQVKNQVPQFMEYATPRPFNSANDNDYGGTSRYLGEDERPNLIASLINTGAGQVQQFLDAAYHRLGAYGEQGCQFYEDEIYHAGKRLSIWLRHEFLRGSHVTNIDRRMGSDG